MSIITTQIADMTCHEITNYSQPRKIVVLLHCLGFTGLQIAETISPVAHRLAGRVICPESPVAPGSWFEFSENLEEQRERSFKHLRDLIVELAWGDNPENISIIGISQGGVLAYELGTRLPMRLGLVVTISSYLFDPLLSQADHIIAPYHSYFIAHGLQDEIIPVESVDIAQRALERIGSQVESKIYPTDHAGVISASFRDIVRLLSKKDDLIPEMSEVNETISLSLV